MPTFRFNKLVRDNLPERWAKRGAKATHRVLTQTEYVAALKEKLTEESQEVLHETEREKLVHELADVQEVLDCLRRALKISSSALTKAQAADNQIRDSFRKRIYAETLTVSEIDPYYEHFNSHSDRYKKL